MHEVGEADGRVIIAMEFIRGESLAQCFFSAFANARRLAGRRRYGSNTAVMPNMTSAATSMDEPRPAPSRSTR